MGWIDQVNGRFSGIKGYLAEAVGMTAGVLADFVAKPKPAERPPHERWFTDLLDASLKRCELSLRTALFSDE